MSRLDRLLAGPGFAVFSRGPFFVHDVLAAYLAADPAVTHVLFVYTSWTEPAIQHAVMQAVQVRKLGLHAVSWHVYGDPENVRAVEALPSEALAIVLADQRRTVGDRLDVRRGYMRRKAARKRIVVDVAPYEAAPWKVYFPFAFFDRSLLGYHHSYAIEQDYDRFLDGSLAENPCDPVRIVERTWQATVVDPDTRLFREPIDVRPSIAASPEHHAEYARFRDGLFENEKSITGVKAKLSTWIQHRYPARFLPHDLKSLYLGRTEYLVPTDLPFDLWLTREILGVVAHTNQLLDLYERKQREAGE